LKGDWLVKRLFLLSLLGLTLFLGACGGTVERRPSMGAEQPPAVVRSEMDVLRSHFQALRSAHPTAKVASSFLADLNGDELPEYVVVLEEKEGLRLWFVTAGGPVEAPGNDRLAYTALRGLFLVDQQEEKHVTLLASYPPQNTKVMVYRLSQGQPALVLDAMADWDARVSADGIEVVWKEFQNGGGYDLQVDKYAWDGRTKTYRKQ
jgi:hypothetical protein